MDMTPGKIFSIHIAPTGAAPMKTVSKIQMVAGKGAGRRLLRDEAR